MRAYRTESQSSQIPQDSAQGYGQWLQYLNRQDDALTLLRWNRDTCSASAEAHQALIQACLHFKQTDAAQQALAEAGKPQHGLNQAQLQALTALLK